MASGSRLVLGGRARPAARSPLPSFALVLTLAFAASCAHVPPPRQTTEPQRAYLEEMLRRDPSGEPRLVFLALSHYGATGQAWEGLAFFESILAAHDDLDPTIRSLYHGAIGTLRAQTADRIPLLRRIAWVERGLGELDDAVRATNGEVYVLRWLRALVGAQLPGRFEREDEAMRELSWLEENAAQAPAPGMLREVLYQRASIHRRRGEEDRAKFADVLLGLLAGANVRARHDLHQRHTGTIEVDQ